MSVDLGLAFRLVGMTLQNALSFHGACGHMLDWSIPYWADFDLQRPPSMPTGGPWKALGDSEGMPQGGFREQEYREEGLFMQPVLTRGPIATPPILPKPESDESVTQMSPPPLHSTGTCFQSRPAIFPEKVQRVIV
jgi:hypothetical protein